MSQEMYFDDFLKMTDLSSAEEIFYKRNYSITGTREFLKYTPFEKNEICNINGLYKLATYHGYKDNINDFIDLLKNNPEAMKTVFEIAGENGYRGNLENLKASVLGMTDRKDLNFQNCNSDCNKIGSIGYSTLSRCESISKFCEEDRFIQRNFAYEWDSSNETGVTFVQIIEKEKRDNLNCDYNYMLSHSSLTISFEFYYKPHFDALKKEIQNQAKFIKTNNSIIWGNYPSYEYEGDLDRHIHFNIFDNYNKDSPSYGIQVDIVNSI